MAHQYGERFPAFSRRTSSSVIEEWKEKISRAIDELPDDEMLNANKKIYIAQLVSKFRIEPLEIHTDRIKCMPSKNSNRHHHSDAINCCVPFSGESWLFEIRPSEYSSSPPEIRTNDDCICFEFGSCESDEMNARAKSMIDVLVKLNNNLSRDLSLYNSEIKDIGRKKFDARKKQIIKKNKLTSSLNAFLKKEYAGKK